MDCNSCGATLSGLTCNYCGADNSSRTSNSAPIEKDIDDLSYEIDLIEKKIEQLSNMPIPEEMKKRKLFLLEEKLSELKRD